MKLSVSALFSTCAFVIVYGFGAASAYAHHSFAVYDIDNKIERAGVLTRFDFLSPHIQMVLEVTRKDGGKEIWKIETMSPGIWDSYNLPRDVMTVGETITLFGWPARNGKDHMALSTIVTGRGTTVVMDEIRQPRARENIPEVTIKRE